MPITQATRNFTNNSIRLQDTGAGTVQTTQAGIVVSRELFQPAGCGNKAGRRRSLGQKLMGERHAHFPSFVNLLGAPGVFFFFLLSLLVQEQSKPSSIPFYFFTSLVFQLLYSDL
jgi:hypothetical protein